MQSLRNDRDASTGFRTAYVLDREQRLKGVVSFRDLFAAAGEKPLAEVMHTDVISVPDTMDQEAGASARFASWFGRAFSTPTANTTPKWLRQLLSAWWVRDLGHSLRLDASIRDSAPRYS